MVTIPQSHRPIKIAWIKPPEDFQLEEEPVENTGQPLIAGALREALELIGYIQPQMLIASNFGLCASLDERLVIKAPDWLYVANIKSPVINLDRKSYTPNLEGDVPSVVIEFLSDTDRSEYSIRRTYPPGKWFFYEQILQIPCYVIFEPATGMLEVYHLQEKCYQLVSPNEQGRYWIDKMGLFLGVWQGTKEERTGYWLRWWDKEGTLLAWAIEKVEQERQQSEQERQRAEQERQRAEQERQRAEQERQKAERLADYLRSQGINPDEI